MTKDDFFKIQSNLTAVKILFFKHYIENFLIKILMQFGSCTIGDLFCGPGKSGQKDGSPLVLLKQAKKILQNESLLKRFPNPKITMIFNDIDRNFIIDLKNELNEIDIPNNIKIPPPTCQEFKEFIVNKSEEFTRNTGPKCFFLDPFGYSNINIDNLKNIMEFNHTEVLLFIPTSQIYRFSNSKKKEEKRIKFLKEFTIKGPGDYSDPWEFVESIQNKLLKEICTDYVREITIDGGQIKNSLFFITKHIVGMNNVNDIFWKYSKDGKVIRASKNLDRHIDLELFGSEILVAYNDYKNDLEQFIKARKKVTNTEVIYFTVKNGMKLKHANDALKQLENQGKINKKHLDKNRKRGFYVTIKYRNDVLCEINYIS
jgi:three-Cys-motif partner protein